MGTRGYYVLRYRNIYFAQYHNYDSYPDGLGVTVLQSMQIPNAITTYRQMLGEILDGLRSLSEIFIVRGDDFSPPSWQRPENDIFIEWIYEIDLDRNIFHINGMPFFSLECLPDDDAFIQYISKDHYGNLACASQCPPEHRYKRPAPPTVSNSDLATYQSSMWTGSHVALSDLLAINDFLSPDEHIRVLLLEVMIGQCMVERTISKDIYNIELVSDHNQFTDDQWSIACFMASITFVPQIFDEIKNAFHPMLERKEFTWVREDIVVCIATHLDEERCLQASVSRLINAIMEQKDNPGEYFGVAFSVYHCAVVKVIKDAHTMKFSHTSALQFLPSFYAHSPSTPGITALARLGFRIDPALFERVVDICHYVRYKTEKSLARGVDGGNDEPPNITRSPLPLELWKEIALYLDFSDLIPFGLVSKLFREAASMILRYPHICGYRLVADPKGRTVDEPFSLSAAAFSAVRAGILATVVVGLQFEDKSPRKLVTPLDVGGESLRVLFSATSYFPLKSSLEKDNKIPYCHLMSSIREHT
ncbi:uncharacterized protein F5147DRAFT_611633 [Suillus discolor]|uniref:F-box domain-containing protein n=1 Tax=Suillus discolor TaxID=1912936 RepID=A0A9P7F8N3_9AGAM|nr:uncharacterized protein F5147DRAFT_611633 [Suillus discolor]KAG2109561.1 hypothetical protein F5147DRAFT_611633 [Suillus discolor]